MAVQQFSSTSLLNALPPCMTCAALVIWALPQPTRPERSNDVEQGDTENIPQSSDSADRPLLGRFLPLRRFYSRMSIPFGYNSSVRRGRMESQSSPGVDPPLDGPSDSGVQLHRRISLSTPNSLPQPSHFDVGDDSDDLESLRSDSHISGNANIRRTVHYPVS
jgi:hypothetical protein